MKKVLIITYYWPPSGGSGVQRWLKFVKYLREFGWEPIVYTPLNPEGALLDASLEKDVPNNITVLQTKIWEPYGLYKKAIGQKKEEKINVGFLTENKRPGLMQKASVWVRSNLFIPDARKYWIKPSVKYLHHYLRNNTVDAIVSTGPPHSMHLIALKLKAKLNIPWLADFRDPWTNIDYYKDLKLTKRADAKHKRLEKQVLQRADRVVAVGKTLARELADLSGRRIDVITNGYDETDFSNRNNKPDEKFSIVHIGAMNADRNPKALWQALAELASENKNLAQQLVIRLIGKTDHSVMQQLNEMKLVSFVEKIDYVPHQEATINMYKAQVLLLALNNTPNAQGIVSGKLFEYIAANRLILAIGKTNGDAADILRQTGAGSVVEFDNTTAMKAEILRLFNLYSEGKLQVNAKNNEQYSRRALTQQLSRLLNEMV